MKTDRELLELAAKASGRNVIWKRGMHRGEPHEGLFDLSTGHVTSWNPLTNGGDALWLAVHLGFNVQTEGCAFVMCDRLPESVLVKYKGGDVFSCVRLAIVRAAAAIGEAMQ